MEQEKDLTANKFDLKKMFFPVDPIDQETKKRKMIAFEELAKQFTDMKFSVW